MTATRKLRWAAVGTVLVLAAVAAYMSYGHLRAVAEGQGEDAAALFPISVDGLIVAASLVLLARRRSGQPGGVLPWAGLLLGVLATIAGNVASAEPTTVARLVAAWPPIAFALSYEYLLTLLRPADREDPAPAPVIVGNLPENLPQTCPADLGNLPEQVEENLPENLPETPAPGLPEQVGKTCPDVADEPAQADVSGRSAGRSKKIKQTCPDDLPQAARDLAEQTGQTPTQYQLRQAFGIGSKRAAQILAGLDFVPADDHIGNGVVTPTEDSQ